MIESLIITLREGIEAALIVGIVLIYLRGIQRRDLSAPVYAGLVVSVLASLFGAIFIQRWVTNEEAFEGFLYFIASLFVGSMLFWMHRHAHHLKRDIEQRVDRLSQTSSHSGWGRQEWGLFGFTFIMIFREGIETVLFLSAVRLTTEALLSFFGGLLGLLLAVLFGVFFVKGSLRIDLKRFFRITEVVLGIFLIQLFINALHEFSESGLLPSSQLEMAIVGPLVSRNLLFLIALVILPLLVVVIPGGKSAPLPSVSGSGPEQRLAKARALAERRSRTAFLSVALGVLLFLMIGHVYSRAPKALSSATAMTTQEGVIRVPVASLQDGHLHRYSYRVGDTEIRFLAMQTGQDRFSATLDGCKICGVQGYYEKQGHVICLNCSAEIPVSTIGKEGGCNPIPIPFQRIGEMLMIQAKALEHHETFFKTGVFPKEK